MHLMPLEAYQNTLEKGHCYQSLISKMQLEPSWGPAYEFMKLKLDTFCPFLKNTLNSNEIYPTWAWPLDKNKAIKNDCRQSLFRKWGPAGSTYIAIVFDKNDSEVLLSDFDCWHFVLNNEYLALEDVSQKTHPHLYSNENLQNSWNQIFDEEFLTKFHFDQNSQNSSIYWQAVCWGIRPEEIVNVKKFVCN